MINAVGLQGPGVAAWRRDELPELSPAGARVVASIWGRSLDDYRQRRRAVGRRRHDRAVEVNLSCPNLEGRRGIFAHDADLSAAVIEAPAVCGLPRWAKLSPNTDRVVEVAGAVHAAGAEAVTLVNTLLGMVIDTDTGRPVLGAGGGGVSGIGIHPVAVRAVFDVRAAHPDLPIIGVGGVIDRAGRRRAPPRRSQSGAGRHRHVRRPASRLAGSSTNLCRVGCVTRGITESARRRSGAAHRGGWPDDTRRPNADDRLCRAAGARVGDQRLDAVRRPRSRSGQAAR